MTAWSNGGGERVEIVRYDARPDLLAAYREALGGGWPEFVFHDPVSKLHHDRVSRAFPEFDLLLLEGDEVLAGAWAVPIAWDGSVADLPDGYDGALIRTTDGLDRHIEPTTLCVMAAAVAKDSASRGLAGRILGGLLDAAEEAGLEHVVVPVRPTLKHRYPLQSMAEYATWRRADGMALDPWIRTHERMGARILGVARRSMVIPGTVAEWEAWTGLAFPATGDYVVPEALAPVHVDLEQDLATYIEDNLWMQHR